MIIHLVVLILLYNFAAVMLGQASAVKYVTKFLNTRPHLLAGFFIALSAVECKVTQ